MNTALLRPITVGLLYAILFSLLPHATSQAEDAAPFGKQVSTRGIKHSFLVTGSITAIIGEDSNIEWQVPERSRDGFVLPNSNVLVSHGREAKEYTREGKVVFQYTLNSVNKELGTVVRLPSGNTVICSYGQRKPEMAKVFEVTREKQVVWEYINQKLTGIHEIHVLTTNGEPTAWPPLK